MKLITVELDPTRIFYTIPISHILTEEDLHIANSTSCSKGDLLDIVAAFVDYQYGFCTPPTAEDIIPQLNPRAGKKASRRLYDVVVTAVARLASLLPETATEVAVMGFSRRNVHILVTIT